MFPREVDIAGIEDEPAMGLVVGADVALHYHNIIINLISQRKNK